MNNATVKLVSTGEGVEVSTQVNQRGEYLFPSVAPGTYSIEVSAPTFSNFSVGSVTVNATENVRVDAKLKTGSATETVVVESTSVTVDTRSATVATVIDPTLVRDLPVDGNNVVALAALLPGVTNVNAPTTFTSDTGGPSYVVSGSRSNQNLYLFDGLVWNNVYYNSGLNFPPPLMLQEVSVQLVNYKAQYGRNVGSVFNTLTKSGTNGFHGDIWEYIQNKALNASDYLSHTNPKLVQNQFGATVGGPIVRDKMFFFLGYQDLRLAAEVISNTQLPTAAERGLQQDGVTPRPCIAPQWAGMTCASFQGDFAATVNPITGIDSATGAQSGVGNPLYVNDQYVAQALTQFQSTAATPAGAAQGAAQCIIDLRALASSTSGPTLVNKVLPYFEIPSECMNPVTLNFYNKYLQIPTVNGVPVTVPTTLPTTANQPRNDQNGFARVDWNFGHGHTIDARFYVTNANDVTANSVSSSGTAVASYDVDSNRAGIYDGNIGDTWVLSPKVLNQFRIGYKRYGYTINPLDPTTLQDLGALNIPNRGHPTLPRFSASQRFSLGSSNSPYSFNVNAGFETTDSVSWTRGNHNFQAGAQYLDMQYIHRYDQTPSLSALPDFSGLAIADFTFGLLASLTVGNSTNIGAVDHAFYFYAQDDWRATARLTLNLGMRYELPFPWYQPDGQSVTFHPGYQSYKFANVPASLAFQGDPGIPNAIIKTNFTNWAPRVGLAYDVFGTGRTVIRAGFGIFYDALNANTTGIGLPYHYAANYSVPAGSFSQPLLGLTPIPPNYTTPANALFPFPYTVNFADPNVTEPYTMAVNFGIQQRIAQGALEVIYVGKFGKHQIIPYDLNPDIYDCNPAGAYYQANPVRYCTGASTSQNSDQERVTYQGFNYGGQGIVDNNTVASSNYNGLQVIYTQRSKGSLTTVASYTYSRSLDDQSNGSTNASTTPLPPNVNTQYGPSDYQATHIVNGGWTLKLPIVRKGSKIERAVLNDWTFGGIFQARTGNPFSPTLTADGQLNAEPNQRAPLAVGLTSYQPLPSNRHRAAKVAEWFNYQSFNPSPPAGERNGVSRNSLYGPAFIETDMRIGRTVALPERGIHVEFRADAFNVFNTPNLANPVSAISGAATTIKNLDHGEILSTVGKNGTVGTNGRRIQLNIVLRY